MKDKILSLHKEGKSYRDIQKLLGCSKGTIAYHLGVGQKDKTLQRQKDKRGAVRKALQTLKSQPCADCKELYPYWIMQFDHLDPKDKKLWLSRAGREAPTAIDAVIEEASKCDVVCANCHANRSFSRQFKNGSNFSWEVTEAFRK